MPSHSGVFSLDDLFRLGQTGDPGADFLSADPKNRAVLSPADRKLPRGYYRIKIPGIEGDHATYVDPRSGQVPREFVEQVLKGPRHPISGVPESFIPDYRERPSEKGEREAAGALDAQLYQERSLGLSREEVQRRRISEQQRRVPVGERPRGVANIAPSTAGAYAKFVAAGGDPATLRLPSFAGYEPSRAEALRDSLAANFMQNVGAQRGLRENRISRGLDPETGISEAEKSRIYETYKQIADPATRAMYVKYQDPGNLVPELRQARQEVRRGELEAMDRANAAAAGAAPEYHRAYFRGRNVGQFRVERGAVTRTDETTGRERRFGGVPTKVEFQTFKTDKLAAASRRFGGGVIGGTMGFFTGGMFGAALGAYQGAGGPMPQTRGWAGRGAVGAVIGGASGYALGGWKTAIFGGVMGGGTGAYAGRNEKSAGGLGDWRSSGGGPPGGGEVATSLAFAAVMRGRKAKAPPQAAGNNRFAGYA